MEKHGKCIIYHIGKVKNKEHAFLIGNIFPVIPKYIRGSFTINNKPYIVEDELITKKINAKTKIYLSMVRYGKLKPFVDILKIEKELLKELKNE